MDFAERIVVAFCPAHSVGDIEEGVHQAAVVGAAKGENGCVAGGAVGGVGDRERFGDGEIGGGWLGAGEDVARAFGGGGSAGEIDGPTAGTQGARELGEAVLRGRAGGGIGDEGDRARGFGGAGDERECRGDERDQRDQATRAG